jgi:preprotein translocase subunit SecD
MAVRITYDIDGDAQVAGEAAKVMQRRLDRLRVAGTVRAEGVQLRVELPALDDDAMYQTLDALVRTGRLTFQLVDAGAAPATALARRAADDPDAAAQGIRFVPDAWRDGSGHEFFDQYLVADDRQEMLALPEARLAGCLRGGPPAADGMVTCNVTGRQVLERYLETQRRIDPALAIPDDRRWLYERIPPRSWRTYYAVRAPAIAGWTITAAKAVDDGMGPRLAIELDPAGAEAFRAVTAANLGHKLAFVLDDRVMSAPIIQGAISGGKLQLVTLDRADAEELAVVLATGPLPAPLREETREEL